MLDRLSHRLNIALGPRGIALVLQRGWFRTTSTLVGRQTWDAAGGAAADLPAALGAMLDAAGMRRMPARVVLADALVRTWRVEPPHNATRPQDCEAAAAMRFGAVFEESPDDWLVTSAPRAAQPFVACAIRRTLADGLERVLCDHQLELLSMEPEYVALWNHWCLELAADAWFGICTDGALVLGVVRSSRLESLRPLPVPEQADALWLSQTVQREANRLNLPAPPSLGLCGTPPAPWVSRRTTGMPCTLLGTHGDALALFGIAT
jgi:hypothetical protein